MGSPMVFQTAPPQPASKARMICSPQFVGGPEASQNGLGLLMPPANLTLRSATQSLHDAESRPLAIGDRVHDFAATADTIAAGKIFWIGRAAGGGIDGDRALVQRDIRHLLQEAG